MNIDPKILAGAAILGGGALYLYVSSDAQAPSKTIAEQNQDRWTSYDTDMQSKLDKRRDEIMSQMTNSDGRDKQQLIEKLTAVNGAQYEHTRYKTQIEGQMNSGELDDKSIWSAPVTQTIQTALNSMQTLPESLQIVSQDTRKNLEAQLQTRNAMDPILNANQAKVTDSYARAQTAATLADLASYATPKEQTQAKQKAQRELDKAAQAQKEADKYKSDYEAKLNSGAFNKTLPAVAQYARNQAAPPTSTKSPWVDKLKTIQK